MSKIEILLSDDGYWLSISATSGYNALIKIQPPMQNTIAFNVLNEVAIDQRHKKDRKDK